MDHEWEWLWFDRRNALQPLNQIELHKFQWVIFVLNFQCPDTAYDNKMHNNDKIK